MKLIKKYRMKNFLLFILLFAMSLPVYPQNKVKKSDLISASIAKHMLDKNLVFYMTNVISDMGTQTYPEGLKVTLIDSKFTCNLPFRGNSSVSTYGSQDLYIKAEDVPVNITSEYNEKKKLYKLSFTFKSTHDNELFETVIKVFTTGKTNIEIYSSKRSTMNYSGGMYVD